MCIRDSRCASLLFTLGSRQLVVGEQAEREECGGDGPCREQQRLEPRPLRRPGRHCPVLIVVTVFAHRHGSNYSPWYLGSLVSASMPSARSVVPIDAAVNSSAWSLAR